MTDYEFEASMEKMLAGEKEGLKKIYEAYVGLIYTVILDVLRHKEDAQDVTSDFFIKLWEQAEKYRFGGKHKAYLITVARNMAIDFLRRHNRELILDELPESEEGYEDFTEMVVSSVSMKEAVKHLKPSEQEVIDLKILGGFTFQEISSLLKKPMGTVTWLYRQAIGKLRQYHGQIKSKEEVKR